MQEDLKERIIKKALQLFSHYGIKAVTMDEIASQLGISKRTLYEVFRDKDTLVLNCLERVRVEKMEEYEEYSSKCSNTLEMILRIYKSELQRIRSTNRNFFSDLKRYHPQVFSSFEENKNLRRKETIAVLSQGMEEGYIRKNLKVDIVVTLLEIQLEMLVNSDRMDLARFSFMEIFETVTMNFVRGIATEKGIKFIEEFEKNELIRDLKKQ